MILEALVDDDVGVAHAERAARLVLPLREPDERQAPQICLGRALHRGDLEQSSRFVSRDRQQRFILGRVGSSLGKERVRHASVHAE